MTVAEDRKENNDYNNMMNDQQPPQTKTTVKTKKELELERIGLQAREFWEKEGRLIASEKETETRRIVAEKELERERIAQAYSLEKQKQQEQEQQQWENACNNDIQDITSSIASPGMVARRAEWLKKREDEANERRRREEENINSLTPRRQQPNTSTTEGNTTTTTSDDDGNDDDDDDNITSHDHDHHNHNCDFEEGLEKLRDQTIRIDSIVENAERKLLQSSEELDEEFQKIQDKLEEAERNLRNKSSDSSCERDIAATAQNNIDNDILHNNSQEEGNIIVDEEKFVSPRVLMDDFFSPDDVVEKNIDVLPMSPNPSPEMKETTTTATTQQLLNILSQSKTYDEKLEEKAVHNIIEPAIIIQQPLIVQSHPSVQQYGAEIGPRTQAMVSGDDIVKPGNSDNHDVSSGSGFNKFDTARKKNNLVLNSFPNQKSRRSRRSSNLDDDEDESKIEFVHNAATFEIPVEVTNDGLKLSPKVADLTMITTIPPSRVGGRISGVLEATSSLGKSNTASGSATIEYKSSKHSRLTLGMIRGFEPCYPLISVGGQILRYGSSFGITYYQNANNVLHRYILDHSLWSLSFRHPCSDSKWCFSSQLSRRQDLSLSLTNNKISGLFGWNLFKPNKLHIRLDARPKLSVYRRAHLYCQWKSGVWNFGISLVQSLHSQIATVGLGWRLFSTRGLEWVITWTRGNAVIRIPIVVSKGLAANATIGQAMYFSVVSYIMQQYIAETWDWIVIGDDNDVSDEAEVPMAVVQDQNLTMARRDAAIQKELMARQARRKTKNEAERDGLIIKDAIYSIKNGDEWNVTIPLQFWVSDSTLKLPGRRKSELLGFYDIITSMKNNNTLSVDSSNRMRRKSTWSDVWNDLFDWTPKDVLLRRKAAAELPSPTLTVSYEFKNQSYQITVKDSEELRLPHLV
jgi:hypothetical protein